MSATAYAFGIVAAVLALLVVGDRLRRRQLRERHALWWLLAGVLALIAAVFPATLEAAARLLGIEVPTNLVFFVSIVILFFVNLQTSAELTKLEERSRTLAERIAFIQLRVERMESNSESSSDSGGA